MILINYIETMILLIIWYQQTNKQINIQNQKGSHMPTGLHLRALKWPSLWPCQCLDCLIEVQIKCLTDHILRASWLRIINANSNRAWTQTWHWCGWLFTHK